MNHSPSTIESAPDASQRRAERRWAWAGAIALVGSLAVTGIIVARLARHQPDLPKGAADHGPLPEAVRQEVLDLLAPHLRDAKLVELGNGGLREFRITGTPKALLSQDFQRAFRPLVVERLRPLLSPYGEILSFEITALDLPPARLRNFDQKG